MTNDHKSTPQQRTVHILYVKLYHLYHIIWTGVGWAMVMQKVPLREIDSVQCKAVYSM